MESDVAKYLDELTTEQPNPSSLGIDTKSTTEILEIINREDATLSEVIHRQIPAIAEVVEVVVERFRRDRATSRNCIPCATPTSWPPRPWPPSPCLLFFSPFRSIFSKGLP